MNKAQIIYIILLLFAIYIMINDYFVNTASIEACGKAWRAWKETNSTCEMASLFCQKVPKAVGEPAIPIVSWTE